MTLRIAGLGTAAGAALITTSLLLGACGRGPIAEASAGDLARGQTQHGKASYYAPHFNGRRMANGERFNPNSNVAAHRTLPLGSVVRVTNLSNGRSATVRVADRGPFVRGRVIDVTPRTAEHLDMKEDGTAPVAVTPLRIGPENSVERREQQASR